MTACAAFFLIVSFASHGTAWAVAISAAVFGLMVCFLLYCLLFALAWCAFSLRRLLGSNRQMDSPFAKDEPPPQVIPGKGA